MIQGGDFEKGNVSFHCLYLALQQLSLLLFRSLFIFYISYIWTGDYSCSREHINRFMDM